MATVEVTYTVGAPQITSSSGRGSVLLTAVNYLDCGLPCTYRSDRHQLCGCYIKLPKTNPSETHADEHPRYNVETSDKSSQESMHTCVARGFSKLRLRSGIQIYIPVSLRRVRAL